MSSHLSVVCMFFYCMELCVCVCVLGFIHRGARKQAFSFQQHSICTSKNRMQHFKVFNNALFINKNAQTIQLDFDSFAASIFELFITKSVIKCCFVILHWRSEEWCALTWNYLCHLYTRLPFEEQFRAWFTKRALPQCKSISKLLCTHDKTITFDCNQIHFSWNSW